MTVLLSEVPKIIESNLTVVNVCPTKWNLKLIHAFRSVILSVLINNMGEMSSLIIASKA